MNSLISEMMTKKRAALKGGSRVVAPRCPTAASNEPLIHNYSNFKRSSCPERVMFYDGGSWVDYPIEVVEVMKLGFLQGKPAIEAQALGSNCFFDFYRMLEIDLYSGNQRSIAWIDTEAKCFFPKFFVNSYEKDEEDELLDNCENLSKIQIEIRITNNSGSSKDLKRAEAVKSSKRKRGGDVENGKLEESFSSSNVKRQLLGSESQSARWPKTRIMAPEQKIYSILKNLFLSGLSAIEPGATVTSIHQCVRLEPLDKARLEVFLKQLEITKNARGQSNMVYAWYGTSAKGVESILKHGFGEPSVVSCSEGHGIGVHLSPFKSLENSAMLSDIDENGEKHVVLCRVILGKCEEVEAGSLQSYPSSMDYDTGVDDLKNPRWYTVWHANMNTHILPECVLSYRPIKSPGSMKPNANRIILPSVFIAKLFSNLKDSRPLPQLKELQTLWVSFKEGKLGRNAFMKQLRAAVGDEVLRSTIQELRG
ncbi:WWE protein-protein interaction domain protein family [Striga asiatica]|uniref:WWE protein-protein interaction domain protein family n=1 Tax=Striga asiatica TaxID=4170 RepID=A0A5A7PEI4_STRAF|nr:WWE protein-protein interaction domain protein family [Striga asiatica]